MQNTDFFVYIPIFVGNKKVQIWIVDTKRDG